ncbi:ATP-binding protein, partial [Marseilla massiliensis]|nr:ATP-binding protein [Marseilla massiliensis]
MEVNNKTAPVTGQQDQNTISLDLMNRMKLHGMAEAFRESLAGTTPQSMT